MINNYICTLELGSSKISAVLATLHKRNIDNLFFDFLPSKGIKKGVIVNSIEVTECVSRLLKNLKARSGLNIKSVYSSVSGQDIITRRSHAIIPLAERGNKLIGALDVQRAVEQARILGSNLEEEIINMAPLSYSIDSKESLDNPIGLYSHKLEVDVLLICAKLSSVQNITRVISQAGYENKGLFFSGLAASRAVFGDQPRNGFDLLSDIGEEKTELLLFKNGALQSLKILPIGGNLLTMELQKKLNLPYELAEDIKKSYGIIAEAHNLLEDKEILIKRGSSYNPISQKTVIEMLTNEAKLICSGIKDAVKERVDILDLDNFMVSGRTALTEGLIETLENTIGIPVKMSRIVNTKILTPIKKETTALTVAKSLAFITPLGMICEILEDRQIGILPARKVSQNLFLRAANKVKEVYQEYF